MDTALKTLWNDQQGFIVTLELILIATIVGIGSIVGLTVVRDALNSELADIAVAIQNLDIFGTGDDTQPPGGGGCNGNGNCGGTNAPVNAASSCIDFSVPPSDEL